MMLVLSRYLLVLGAVVASLAGAAAQQYPAKTITLVVPAAPGGVTDILARSLGQRFRESFGQPVVVENKPGASNQIAAEYVARSSGDGYTLLVSPEATVAINPYLFGKLRYDAAKDFVPVAGLVKIHQALVTNPSVPAHSVADFIALAKKQPGSLNYGTYGVGSTGHLNMEMFEAMAAVQLVAIHYKGATPALTDVIAGHIQAMFISVGSAIQPWKAGELNLLAVGSKERLASLPDIPTIAEGGLSGFEAASWFGLFAPAGTPPAIVDQLNAQTQRVLAEPGFRAAVLDPQFFEPMVGSPQEFADFIKADAEKWRRVIRVANVKVE
ncbi:MAG: Bug family tripartite tricarboxylate transporter substrate binding protein [Xanthobacteraceae bacterium]